MFDNSHSFLRIALGFHNPNHAAALVCALLPLGWGWRGRLGRVLSGGLFAMLLLTQSRTGLLVAGLEVGAWWWTSRRGAARSASAPYRRRWLWIVPLVLAGLALWWMGPRLVLDDSILNRPKIWLAGLQLFAANPSGVGLGNSGTLASAFLLDGIPEIRTMISAHITLLAEFGWIVGWAWLAFIGLALCGVRVSPRVGTAFAGLVLSGCSSTVFDWPVLFDFAEQGGLGAANWILSWLTLALFVVFGVWLIVKSATQTGRRGEGEDGLDRIDKIDRIVEGGAPRLSNPVNPVNPVRKTPCLPSSVATALNAIGIPVLFAGALVLAARCVPPGDAPRVQGGYAASGAAPRALALYDDSWSLRVVRARAGADALLPVRPVTRFPRGLDLSSVRCVLLFGDCREWAYLVPKGISVTCVED